MTSDLIKRIWQHQNHLTDSFTRRHEVHLLVWYEVHATMVSAIAREKAIKAWKRVWKLQLIEKSNPEWRDLYPDII